jgi:hypothetical protein
MLFILIFYKYIHIYLSSYLRKFIDLKKFILDFTVLYSFRKGDIV